ncbi:MAG TPA: hypothetical protein VHO06_20050 [Polyangia bacterium]|nr:hypothetical protein [Polyangia bacterium]
MTNLSKIDTSWKPGGPPWCHARRFETEVAVRGELPRARDFWSDRRSRITLQACFAEIDTPR